MQISDKKLLEEIAGKDKTAFNLFYERYRRLFYSLAYSRTNNKEMTNDIMQNFWMIVWKSPGSIKTDPDGSAKKYLYKYFTSRMSDYLCSADARTLSEEDENLLEQVTKELTYTHVIEELAAKEIYEMMDITIQSMPLITQQIFVNRWKKGYSEKETATMLGLSESTVHERYNWALSYLRKKVMIQYPQDSYTLIIAMYILEQLN